MTNILVEGGGRLLGAFFDAALVDEAHVFIGPKIIGSRDARSPVAGSGVDAIAGTNPFTLDQVERLDDDVYLHYVK
jgi:diaminohydroxyphosphoribosylaminopyrimidine deaminase/5-amino-6-(5-phosphoribosylamino)uracil reductase